MRADVLESVPRERNLLTAVGELALELVAESANGHQVHRVGGVGFDLGPQPLDVDVERFGVSDVVGAPDPVDQLATGEYSPSVDLAVAGRFPASRVAFPQGVFQRLSRCDRGDRVDAAGRYRIKETAAARSWDSNRVG